MGDGSINISHLKAEGNIYLALGGAQITLINGQPSFELTKLDKIPLEQAVDENGVDVFKVLRWDYGLAQTLYGRQKELDDIVRWAELPTCAALARLVSGEGGTGKTRLAAEVARVLKERGWEAGFLPGDPRKRPFCIKEGKGLFLILDYSEEKPDVRKWVFDLIADVTDSPCPIRVLLLSRRTFADWDKETLRLEGRFGKQAIANLGALSEADGIALVKEAASRFSELVKKPIPSFSGAAAWLGRDFNHRVPLFACAAAIHAVQAPECPFGLDGEELMRDLARRERRRVDAISKSLGIGETALSELLALGVLAGGLGETEIRNLASEMASAGTLDCAPEQLLDRLRNTPWWRAGNLRCLEPDRPAAAFLEAALFPNDLPDGRKELPNWLFATLKDRVATFAGRFSRIRHDLFSLSRTEIGSHPLDLCFDQMFKSGPLRATAFEVLAFEDVTMWVARVAATVCLNLVNITEDAEHRASLLHSAANNLSKLGQKESALSAVQEAVTIRRTLAATPNGTFASGLVGSLNTLAAIHSELGQRESALTVAQEAVTICRALAEAQPESSRLDLATSLESKGNRLSELGQREDALDAVEEATALYRVLAAEKPDIFTPRLAASLSNLAARLSELGRDEEALKAAKEAIAIRRDLIATRPGSFMPELSLSISNLAVILSKLGRHQEALEAGREMTMIRRDLATANAEAFAPDLAGSLNNLAVMYSEVGEHKAALEAIRESVTICRKLAATWPEAFRSLLADSLNNMAASLSELGLQEDALKAAQESVAICRYLTIAHPKVYAPNLAGSLTNLATVNSNLGRKDNALSAVREAVGLLSPFFLMRPLAFMKSMITIIRVYIEGCYAVGQQPDFELLRPVIKKLNESNQDGSGRHRQNL